MSDRVSLPKMKERLIELAQTTESEEIKILAVCVAVLYIVVIDWMRREG